MSGDEGLSEPMRTFVARAMPLLSGSGVSRDAPPRVTAIAGDGSTRRFFRVEHAGARAVVLFNPLPPGRPRPDENDAYLYVREQLHLRRVRVPALYAADLDAGLLLLEDLGDRRLFDVRRSRSAAGLYRQALGHLARMQMPRDLTWDPRRTHNLAYTAAFVLEHEAGYFHRELRIGCTGSNRPWEALAPELQHLAEEATRTPPAPVLMHRDFQSRNLMVLGGVQPVDHAQSKPAGDPDTAGDREPPADREPPGVPEIAPSPALAAPEVAVIDFQGARLGPAEYDLAALLYDPYVALSAADRENLVDHYRAVASGMGVPGIPGPDAPAGEVAAWRRRLLASAANRLMQALGAFARLGVRQGRPGFREFIAPGLAQLIDVLEERSDCPELLAEARAAARHPLG